MLRALLVIFNMYSATKSADRYQARYGLAGRLRILVRLPAQTAATYFISLATLRLTGPIRQLLGRPAPAAADRVAAIWVGLLAGARVPGGPMSAGLTLSTLDSISRQTRAGGWGSTSYLEAVEALDDDELRAVLAHEIGHLRFAHVMLISFATAALAAGWPPLIRHLMGVKGQDLEGPKINRRDERETSVHHKRHGHHGRHGRRNRALNEWLEGRERKKAIHQAESQPRARAATALSVVSAAAILAAFQRVCERSADDYAASVAGPGKLASAMATIESQRVVRDSRPGRRAAMWRIDEWARRSILALFSPDPSPASRIARLARQTG